MKKRIPDGARTPYTYAECRSEVVKESVVKATSAGNNRDRTIRLCARREQDHCLVVTVKNTQTHKGKSDAIVVRHKSGQRRAFVRCEDV